jgi:toxin-antitoxin system PIN domain toxin
VWLALAIEHHQHHPAASAWLASVPSGDRVLFCRPTQLTFLRLVGSRSVLGAYGLEPLSNEAAWATFELFVEDERISLQWDEPAAVERFLKEFGLRSIASPKLWMDAYLAAFAAAAGATMVTADRGFHQFPGLEVIRLQ